MNDGVNAVYRARRGGEAVYLRAGPSRYVGPDKAAGAAAYLDHVATRGAPVCAPLRSEAGRLVEAVRDGDEVWQATVVRAVPGERLDPIRPTPEQVRAWGRALGELHAAGEGFVPPPGALVKDFATMWREAEAPLAAHEPRLLPLSREVDAWREALPREEGALGVTHGDTRAGNALWDGARVRLIDFDEPNTHFLVADLARPLLEAGPERRSALRPHLVAGYREARPLSDFWAAQLPMFERERALIFLGWTLEDGPLSGSAPTASGLDSSDGRAFNPWIREALLAGAL